MKWIKAGLEYTGEQTKRSVVISAAGGQGADWSMAPHPSPIAGSTLDGRVRAVVEFEREGAGAGGKGDLGSSLFVKVDGQIVRECAWVFALGEMGPFQVGFYGARPAKGDDVGNLEVRVEVFEVEEQI